MDEKMTLSAAPNTAGWEKLLLAMPLRTPLIFYNIDNTANNGRQAIKRYYRKALINKVPTRKFTTSTDKQLHSFTITREE